jgi:hypothetical protein
MKVRSFFAALVMISAPLTPLAFGQSSHSSAGVLDAPLPACSGVYSIVRIVDLKPGTTIDQYNAALAAHQAWYKQHSYDDVIYAAQVIEREEGSGHARYSKHLMLTYHFFKPTSPHPAKDAAWDAFVKMYTETSDLKESYFNCVPMEHAPHSLK